MDKTWMGLLAAVGAAAPLAGAQAAVTSGEAHAALRVNSVAELLEPVENAPAILAALDTERRSEAAERKGDVEVAQFYYHHHHHHHFYHHHHHHHWHHHHHHHFYHHHHHHWYHHHHHHFYFGF